MQQLIMNRIFFKKVICKLTKVYKSTRITRLREQVAKDAEHLLCYDVFSTVVKSVSHTFEYEVEKCNNLLNIFNALHFTQQKKSKS